MTEQAEKFEGRRRVIALRLTPAEHAALADAAHRARLPLAVFVRGALSGAPPPAAPRGITPGGQLDQILAQLRGLSTNVNQISRVLNTPSGIEQVFKKAPGLLPFFEQLDRKIHDLALEIKKRGES